MLFSYQCKVLLFCIPGNEKSETKAKGVARSFSFGSVKGINDLVNFIFTRRFFLSLNESFNEKQSKNTCQLLL